MFNIKQKFLKFTISFVALLYICGCKQVQNLSNNETNLRDHIVNIAILMPTSGPKQHLGKEYIQMIKMGLSDGAKTKMRVTSYDAANKGKLNESLEKIFDAGTDIIIGPIHSSAAKIIRSKIKGKTAIALSFSNAAELADEQLFIFGHEPIRQIESLTNYFLENNYKNYIALLPSGKRSILIGKIIQDIIHNINGNTINVEFYESSPESITKSVKAISDQVDNLNENDFNLTKPVILIADDAATLQILYDSARNYGLDKKAVIAGDNRVDIDSTHPLNITFTGSLNIINSDIIARAKEAGVQHVSSIHAIAYDAGKMIGNNIGARFNKIQFLNRMNSPEKFIGLSGDIHFVDSIAQRQYQIIRKQNGRYILISNDKLNDNFNLN